MGSADLGLDRDANRFKFIDADGQRQKMRLARAGWKSSWRRSNLARVISRYAGANNGWKRPAREGDA
jgi:hypothetical protein